MPSPNRTLVTRLALILTAIAVLIGACGDGQVLLPAESTVAGSDRSTTAPETPGREPAPEASVPEVNDGRPAEGDPERVPDDAAYLEEVFDVEARTGVAYGTGATAEGDQVLQLDAYLPIGDPPPDGWPAAVLIHGGGFRNGSRSQSQFATWATELASRGIAAVSIDYRLAGDEPIVTGDEINDYFTGLPAAGTPTGRLMAVSQGAAMEDAIAAARWLIGQGADPDRLIIGGSSAGAITALNAAYLPDDIGAEAPEFAAVLDLWGGITATPGDATAMDPGDPPVWIVHGTADETVSFEHATTIAARGEDVGVEVILHDQTGAGHSWREIDIFTDTTDEGVVLFDDQVEFLARVLAG
jgi:acetyl esterase/lipase